MDKTKEWYLSEWKDGKKILSYNKERLYWEIWKSRSNSLMIFLLGIVIGMGSIIVAELIK